MALLRLSGISKRFGSTQALADVGFELMAGQVHALCGANGAGKSTLARVMSGHIQPDQGRLTMDSRELRLASSRDALRSGICLVTQETTLAPDLSVLENIMLPRLAMPGRLDWRRLRREAERLIASLGDDATLPIDAPAATLSIGQKQLLEILKALALDSRIIVFDEPTASLSPFESEILFDIMRGLARRGHGLIFVSHRMEEIFAVCDCITVLREGRAVGSGLPIGEVSAAKLVQLMIGREVADVYARVGKASRAEAQGEPVLRVRGLASPPLVRDVSFEVRAGEILGLAGLIGAGRSETLETIFGLRKASGGLVELGGRRFRPKHPADAIRAGIGLVPEDRRHQSIVPDLSVRENLFLAHLGEHRGGGLGYGARMPEAGRLLDLLGLPRARLDDPDLLNFSGGMQQKIILARWLLLKPRLLMLDEPTRGVDIGTRGGIYALLRRIAAEGVAVVVVSSDFAEVIGLADRVAVMSDGVSVAEFPSDLVTVESLAMFAAPRSSAQRTHRLLESLAATHDGVACWIGLDGARLFCFDRMGTGDAADPGFSMGQIHDAASVRIPSALRQRSSDFVTEADGRHTLLVPVLGRSGHELGLIALILPANAPVPAADDVARHVRASLAVLEHAA